MTRSPRPAFGTLIFFAIAFALSLYFTFAAVQGDFGLFRRAEILAETQNLRAQLETVRADVARMENLTHRLSDNYLDLDLLDERARKVLPAGGFGTRAAQRRSAGTLVLNADYTAISFTSERRGLLLMMNEKAQMLEQ